MAEFKEGRNVLPIVINEAVYRLEEIECPDCGVLFAISEKYKESLRESNRAFYCPNGHNLHYPKKVKRVPDIPADKEQKVGV